MKSTLLLSFLTLTTLFSTAQESDGKVVNDQNAQKRTVQGFHAIEISSGVDLYLNQGGEEAVAVSAADPEDRDRIVTEVSGGALHIYINNVNLRWLMHNHRRLRAYVSCKQLDQLSAHGGSDVFVQDGLHSDNLKVHLSGGSDLRGKFTVGDLSIEQSGGADAYVTGTARSLYVHTTGGSDYHGYDLSADNCEVEASGGSDIYCTVNKELKASAHGGSDVHYKGNGSLRGASTGGSGSISHRD
jgi:hypothetical protein